MTGYDLLLPYPPALNTYYRNVGGKVLISREGRTYRQRVWYAVHQAIPNLTTLTERLAVCIYATMPDRRLRDLDGLPKATLDALTHAKVWEDDGLIDDLHLLRVGVKKPGQLFIRISIIGEFPTHHVLPLGANGESVEAEPLTLGASETGE